jgi:hypothetical protein
METAITSSCCRSPALSLIRPFGLQTASQRDSRPLYRALSRSRGKYGRRASHAQANESKEAEKEEGGAADSRIQKIIRIEQPIPEVKFRAICLQRRDSLSRLIFRVGFNRQGTKYSLYRPRARPRSFDVLASPVDAAICLLNRANRNSGGCLDQGQAQGQGSGSGQWRLTHRPVGKHERNRRGGAWLIAHPRGGSYAALAVTGQSAQGFGPYC